ncbi:MAG TPA: hypothetical protein VGG01_02395 [Xanthobacteraceae bacterium]|jgi:hypothetical protein
MKRSRLYACMIAFSSVATLTIGLAPAASAAQICPQFLAKYCVVTKSGHRMTAATNPCFAKQRHWRILYRGACHRHR